MFLDFILQNWLGLLILIIVAAYLIYLSITRQWVKVREFAYQLMLLAEKTFADGEGKIKFDFVVDLVYRNLPVWLRIFIRKGDIQRLIQSWYDTVKDFLDDGQINQSVELMKKRH